MLNFHPHGVARPSLSKHRISIFLHLCAPFSSWSRQMWPWHIYLFANRSLLKCFPFTRTIVVATFDISCGEVQLPRMARQTRQDYLHELSADAQANEFERFRCFQNNLREDWSSLLELVVVIPYQVSSKKIFLILSTTSSLLCNLQFSSLFPRMCWEYRRSSICI